MINLLKNLSFQHRPIFTMVIVVPTMVFIAPTVLFVVPTVAFVFSTLLFVVPATVFVVPPMVFAVPNKVFFVPPMVFVSSTMASVFSTMDFGVEKMLSSLETIFSKPETTVDVLEIMFSTVGEPAAVVQLTQQINLTKELDQSCSSTQLPTKSVRLAQYFMSGVTGPWIAELQIP